MELKSDRLILRELSEKDLDFMYEMERNELVYFYEEDEEPSKEQVHKAYSKRINSMKKSKDEYFILLISTHAEGNPVGQVNIQLNWEEIREWEIGYALHPDYWGNGYASEAAKLLIENIFKNFNAHKVVAFCNGNNKKSANLLERIGMKRDGVLREGRRWRNEWCDEFVYSMLEKDYFALNK